MLNGGVKEISFSGGEPLLHPNIKEIISFCHDLGIYTTLYTSGIIQNVNEESSNNALYNKILDQYNNREFSEIPSNLLLKLQNAGLNKIVFDMQASEVDEYNLLMGTKNNFANLLKSILNASKFNFKTSIHFVPNKVNINQFNDIFELAEIARISEVRILKFVPQGRGKDNQSILQLSNSELDSFIKDCMSITSTKTKLKIGIPLQNQNQHKCTAGFDKIDIRYDGQILPCPAFKDLSEEELKEKGFNSVNIYKNLTDFKFYKNENRDKPLCSQTHEDNL